MFKTQAESEEKAYVDWKVLCLPWPLRCLPFPWRLPRSGGSCVRSRSADGRAGAECEILGSAWDGYARFCRAWHDDEPGGILWTGTVYQLVPVSYLRKRVRIWQDGLFPDFAAGFNGGGRRGIQKGRHIRSPRRNSGQYFGFSARRICFLLSGGQ